MAYRILVATLEGKRRLRRSGYEWENDIQMDINEIGCKDVDLTHLSQDLIKWQALVNTIMKLDFIKDRDFFYQLSKNHVSRKTLLHVVG
jgi:hypothetical protein